MKGMTLYQIDASIESILNGFELVNTETGEIYTASLGEVAQIPGHEEDIARAFEALDALQMERADKIESICCIIKNNAALADDIKAEEKMLSARRKAAENSVDRLKAYLSQSLNGEKFETAKAKVSFRKNPPSAEIIDASKLTSEYMREIPAKYEPDKTKIKEALKAGKAVEGAELRQTVSCYVK